MSFYGAGGANWVSFDFASDYKKIILVWASATGFGWYGKVGVDLFSPPFFFGGISLAYIHQNIAFSKKKSF